MAVESITLNHAQLAKTIDHSLLHPTLTDADIVAGLKLARELNVAAACVKPYSVPVAAELLAGSGVLVCAVVGFPHGNSVTEIKVAEALRAIADGAHEIDVVVNVGKVLGEDWAYVEQEIGAVNTAVTANGASLKVIFENDFLGDAHIVRLCQICTTHRVAFVKTSTGYGYVKQGDGKYSYAGATAAQVTLMKKTVGAGVQIKAAGGVRTFSDAVSMLAMGVTRIGATATKENLDEATRRGVGDQHLEVSIKDLS